MSTHNICFHGQINKISVFFSCKKKCLICSCDNGLHSLIWEQLVTYNRLFCNVNTDKQDGDMFIHSIWYH